MTLEQREAGESGHIADHNEIADILNTGRNDQLAYVARDGGAFAVNTTLTLAGGGDNLFPADWTIEDGTSEEEDWWSSDLTASVLQVPSDGTLLWHVHLVMSANLSSVEHIRGYLDFASDADPVFGAESEWAAGVIFAAGVLNPDARDTWTSAGWSIARTPATRFIVATAGVTNETISDWKLSIVKVT